VLKVNGFTLVEILVASLIIMMGVTGYVTLQSQYVMADNAINLRYLAMQLAQEKVDDLGFFEQIQTTVGKYSYNNIKSNSGGTIAAGPIYVALSANSNNTQLYHMNWKIVDYFYVDTDSDTKADSWVKVGEPFYPSKLPRVADLKTAKVEVSWINNSGVGKKVTILSQIAPILPSNSFHTKFRTTSTSASP